MDWPILVLVAIGLALGAIATWRWSRPRDRSQDEPDAPGTLGIHERSGPAATGAPLDAPAPPPTTEGEQTTTGGSLDAPAPPPATGEPPEPAATISEMAVPSTTEGAADRFGPGSAVAGTDGSGPDGWLVKGNAESRLYHTPSSPSWKRLHAEVWFESEAAAEAAGFRRWDWRRHAP